MTDGILPTHNWMISCHLTGGKMDVTQPIRMALVDSETTQDINIDQATAMLDLVLKSLTNEEGLIVIDPEDIQQAMIINGIAWISCVRGSSLDNVKEIIIKSMQHPALSTVDDVKYVLASLGTSDALSVECFEEVAHAIECQVSAESHIKIALHFDNSLQDDIVVSIIAIKPFG